MARKQTQVTVKTATVDQAPTEPVTYVPFPIYAPDAFTRPLSNFGPEQLTHEEKVARAEAYEQEKVENEAIAKALALVAAKSAKPAPSGQRGVARFSKDATISILAASNPKRPGSLAYERFELYETASTVATFLAAGGRRVDLDWDAKHGFIQVG